ncbi:hypothetical protein JK364_45855 [Streptomyces sp. 110]|uniref:Uncharacterized protein n=1 Tax=Streptomyces endocoffeicus TaxID=2898945 RepID=A0ABS1Q4X3_9ACTN|nr:hypothetical protein [Streptomyces endocoffeicus]MBL1119609.1 hypothetical protein [Streptomyces endocoffeicus]
MESRDEGLYLLETYETLDNRLGLNISERIRRVLLDRKILEEKDLAGR